MIRCRTVALICIAGLVLPACTVVRQSGKTDWDARESALLQQQVWSFRGRVAVRDATGHGGQASLRWHQSGDDSELRVSGPFGAGAVEIFVGPGRVSVRDTEGETLLDYDGPEAAERWMAEQLGWSLPLRSARYWVLGLPDPAVAGKTRYDENGNVVGLEQRGWSISLQRFSDVEGLLLPVRLVMENPLLRVRLAISQWSLN